MKIELLHQMTWLNSPFKQLVHMYKDKQGHHALLIQSPKGVGEKVMVASLAEYLLCQADMTHRDMPCQECKSCQLLKADNHPDWHILVPEKDKKSIGVDAIRQIITMLYQHANQGGAKIVQIDEIECLTEAASNALLKILEEPPLDTFFLLSTYTLGTLLATIKSRCLTYTLKTPTIEAALPWLQANNPTIAVETLSLGLKLSHQAPLLAAQLLSEERWLARNQFFDAITTALTQNNYLQIVPFLLGEMGTIHFEQLLSLLLDAIKYQTLVSANHPKTTLDALLAQSIVNIDRYNILAVLAQHDPCMLQNSLQHAVYLADKLTHNSGLNVELLITQFLVQWQNKQLIALSL